MACLGAVIAVDRLHAEAVCPVGALFGGEVAQGVRELVGEVGGVGDLLEVDDHVVQVVLVHRFEDRQVQGGGAAGGRSEGRVLGRAGELLAQVGFGDGGDHELVVGQDAVVDGVGVGVRVQAGAEGGDLVHGRQAGGRVPFGCCGGGGLRHDVVGGWILCQPWPVPLVRGRGQVQAALRANAVVVVDGGPFLVPGTGRAVCLVHNQQVEHRGR